MRDERGREGGGGGGGGGRGREREREREGETLPTTPWIFPWILVAQRVRAVQTALAPVPERMRSIISGEYLSTNCEH